MSPTRSRNLGSALLSAVLWLGGPTSGTAADHGDGRFGLSVFQGLAEGPPFPAAPVELDAEVRRSVGQALPAGQLHLTLRDADDGSGGALALTGSAVDNGEPFGESGDTVTMDVYYVEGSPPSALPQVTGFNWGLRPEQGPPPNTPQLEFTAGEPMVLDVELFFQDYGAEVRELGSGMLIEHGRIRARFEIADGQDLQFEAVQAIPPDASGELRYTGSLRRTAGGSFDPAEPLYRITIDNAPPRIATAPLVGPVILALALGLVALFALRNRVRPATRAPGGPS